MKPRFPLACCLVLLLLLAVPLAHAGTYQDPEVTDPKGDAGGVDALDLLRVWVDEGDAHNLTFHIALAGAPPTGASHCGQGCVYAALAYNLYFRVLDPSGAPAPQWTDYASSYVAFRVGPSDAQVATSLGFVDTHGTLSLDASTATGTAKGTNLTVSIPRSSSYVAIPDGATPGAYVVDHLYATSDPELCVPAQNVPTQGSVSCAPLDRPQQTSGTPPVGTSHAWDRAPDSGYGLAYTFPVPASPVNATPPAQTTTTLPPPAPQPTTPSPTPTSTPTQAPRPSPTPTQQPTPTPSSTSAPAPQPAAPTSAPAQKSPAPSLGLALLGIAGVALLRARRRLNA